MVTLVRLLLEVRDLLLEQVVIINGHAEVLLIFLINVGLTCFSNNFKLFKSK